MSTGRVVIVTGAGSGLGFHVAKLLSSSGHDVILAGRDEEQIKNAVDSIKQVHSEATLSHLQLDVSSLESVRKFADEFHALGKKLHGLITCDGVKLNNAVRCRRYSPDNFELTMATNHLGHFLLTNLLLGDLKAAAAEEGSDARVVVVSSSMHDTKMSKQCKNLQPLDLDNLLLFNEKTYSSLQAYKNSRAANVMFAYELARRVQDSGIKVNAICPGVEPVEEGTGNGVHKVFAQVFKQCITAPEITHDKCAVDICSLLTEEKYKDMTGKYVVEGVDVPSSDETMNEELQSKLWELSARYVRLDGYEPLEVVPPPAEEETKKKDEKTNKKKNKKNKTDDDENSEDKLIVQNGHNEDEKGGEDDAQNNETAEENGVHVDSEPANGGESVDENGAGTTANDEVENIKNASASNGVAEENGVENNGESKVEESPAVDIEQQEPLIQNGNEETAQ